MTCEAQDRSTSANDTPVEGFNNVITGVGGENDRGKRLLTQTIDHYAKVEPRRVFACIPRSNDPTDGFRDIDMEAMAASVNNTARWLDKTIGPADDTPEKTTISYVGPSDLRYSILFFASIKCRRKLLFISPRNTQLQNISMLRRSGCQVLLFAPELSTMVEKLGSGIPALETLKVPSLAEILDKSSIAFPYPFTASYEDIKDDHCLILHSSGSTGEPKLVYMTHGAISVTDNDTHMPVPAGRRAQNAAQFNFCDSGRFYSCFPPYHMAGVQAYIIIPVFSKTATVVMGPPMTPPSGFLLSEIMKQQHLRGFYAPPFIIEQWATEPMALEQAKSLKFVLYGGGPLSPSVGNALSKVTDVCQMYGSLEIGQVQMLIPLPGQW
ncbi:hypothetical protein FQN49_003230, partial [Arthroderma sp. PD_2]